MKKFLFLVLVPTLMSCGKAPTAAPAPAAAPELQITAHLLCKKDGPSGLHLTYEASTYSNGDVLSRCVVADNNQGVSGSEVDGTCVVYRDLDCDAGGTYLTCASQGQWNFTATGATYVDKSSASNGDVVAFAESDCTK